MSYTNAEGRLRLLDAMAEAIDEIGAALSALGDAYEQLDEYNADQLEEQLFRPVQMAYGRAKRAHTDFADRYDLPLREFSPRSAGVPSIGARGFVEVAVEAIGEADAVLSELQDSMLPVEVGDTELRAALGDVRTIMSSLSGNARQFVRTLGR